MKVIDILNKKHTALSSVDGYFYHQGLTDYTQTILDMKTILFSLGKLYKHQIDKLRQMEYHSKEQKQFKERFPVWFVGGTFPFEHTDDVDILEYTNILAIDIDKIDNNDIDLDTIKKKIFDLPYVFAVLNSISGQGYYALMLVEDGRYTKEYYTYISKLWNKQYGLNIDTQCTNIGRKRFLSYEDNINKWIKPNDVDIVPWKLKYVEQINVPQQTSLFMSYKPKQYDNNDLARKAIWILLDRGFSIDDMNCTEKYGAWYHIACDFHHFDDGLDMFIKFSQNSIKYNDNITKVTNKYNNGKIEQEYDNVAKKWCGICKRKYGKNWMKL